MPKRKHPTKTQKKNNKNSDHRTGLSISQLLEMTVDVIMKFFELAGHVFLTIRWLQKFHSHQSLKKPVSSILQGLEGSLSACEFLSPGNLPLGQIVIAANILQHPNTLVKGAETIIRRETVLGQEIVLDNLGDLKSQFILIRQRIFSNQLHNLHLLILDLKNFSSLGTKIRESRVVLLEEAFKRLQGLSPRVQPIHRRKMFSLSKFLVQPPEALHNSKSRGSDRVSEITTRGGDSTDDGDGTMALGLTQSYNTSSTFVKGSKTSTQISRITRVGRHLSQTTGNLTQSLSPTRSGVSHHSNIVTLITIVFSKGDTSVNRSLTGSDRHVRCVCHKSCTFHNGLFLVSNGNGKGRKFIQHLSHFVTTLTASDIDDNIRVGVFGEGLRDDSFTTSESTRNSSGTALGSREKRIQNTLSSQKRVVARQFLGSRSRTTDRPVVHHCVVSAVAIKLDLQDCVCKSVLSLRGNEVNFPTSGVRGEHNTVLDEGILLDNTEDVTCRDVVSSLGFGDKVPFVGFGESLGFDTIGDEDALGLSGNILQRALDTIEDTPHDTRTQLYRQRKTRASDRVTDLQPRGFLVHLNGGRALLQLNDLTDQFFVTNTNQFVHERTLHILGNHDRTSDGMDNTLQGLILLKSERGETGLEIGQT
mmetsp:Transcript_13758/g.21366  ORF Transcript_13758/g.21366 Transcript_13758/m.21366 type:complete len:645 (-) Transcript_13758:325-2259(-)